MYLFRGEAPVAEFAANFPLLQRVAIRMIGKRFFREYPYEEAYLLPTARRFREALNMPLILLGGITERATIERAMAEGFEYVAMARALLEVPQHPEVEREPLEDGVLLKGPEDAVLAEAVLLREAGLE